MTNVQLAQRYFAALQNGTRGSGISHKRRRRSMIGKMMTRSSGMSCWRRESLAGPLHSFVPCSRSVHDVGWLGMALGLGMAVPFLADLINCRLTRLIPAHRRRYGARWVGFLCSGFVLLELAAALAGVGRLSSEAVSVGSIVHLAFRISHQR
jgi:hypothetical protein